MQLKDEVRDWYWWILDRFSFIYKFSHGLGGEAISNANEIGYRLFPLLNCKQLAVSSYPRNAYFVCNDVIVDYWAPTAPPPKRELRKRIEEIVRKIKRELFSLRISYYLFDITTATGMQPEVDLVKLGAFRIQRVGLSYGNTLTLSVYVNWEFIPAGSEPVSEVAIHFSSPTAYEIGYSISTAQKKRESVEQQAVTILTDIYNNREQIINYISKSRDLLFQFFNGLTTYLLY
jgi:hypothetical protein